MSPKATDTAGWGNLPEPSRSLPQNLPSSPNGPALAPTCSSAAWAAPRLHGPRPGRHLSGPAAVRHSPGPGAQGWQLLAAGPSLPLEFIWTEGGCSLREPAELRDARASLPAAGAGMRGKREGRLSREGAGRGKPWNPARPIKKPWSFRQGRKGAELWAGF